MYLPAHFREDDPARLHAAIEAAPLGTLVTLGPGGLAASPVPMLHDPAAGPHGTLLGHLARANPQWKDIAAGAPALAIFMGPDAYVSPSWYPGKAEHGKVVPTWNYVAVHARGALTFFDDPARLLALVARLTDRHEGGRPAPWKVSDAPPDYVQAQLRAIVGFELRIETLDGKWKLSQNRPEADRTGIADGLQREGDADVAALVRDRDRGR